MSTLCSTKNEDYEMASFYRVKRRISKYKSEIYIAALSTVLGVLVGKLADTYLTIPTSEQVILSLVLIVLFSQIGQMFIINRNFLYKIHRFQRRLPRLNSTLGMGALRVS